MRGEEGRVEDDEVDGSWHCFCFTCGVVQLDGLFEVLLEGTYSPMW